MSTAPGIRYAQSGEVGIAYRKIGAGPREIVVVPGFVWNLEAFWEEPVLTPIVERLASLGGLTLFDKRGQGLSDRSGSPATLEQAMDDVLAVMDDAGIERAVLFGISEGGPMAQLFAASHPQRVEALVLYGSYARILAADDYPHGVSDEQLSRFAALIRREWGGPVAARYFAPSMLDDPLFLDAWARFVRRGSGPRAARDLVMLYREIDTRAVLPAISAPTLVLHRTGDRLIPIESGRFLAENIGGARLVELPGDDHLFAVDPDAILDELEEFVTGGRRTRDVDRVLATVLFTDIVGSTERAAALGDRRWRALGERHDAIARNAIEAHRGRVVKTLGDGLLATFDGPARAIRAAGAIERGTAAIGLDVRAGLHTGELELLGDDVGGIAVNIAARVSALAGAGEVLVSSTVKDLVVGSGIEFEERGTHELRGVPGEWRVFAASG